MAFFLDDLLPEPPAKRRASNLNLPLLNGQGLLLSQGLTGVTEICGIFRSGSGV